MCGNIYTLTHKLRPVSRVRCRGAGQLRLTAVQGVHWLLSSAGFSLTFHLQFCQSHPETGWNPTVITDSFLPSTFQGSSSTPGILLLGSLKLKHPQCDIIGYLSSLPSPELQDLGGSYTISSVCFTSKAMVSTPRALCCFLRLLLSHRGKLVFLSVLH